MNTSQITRVGVLVLCVGVFSGCIPSPSDQAASANGDSNTSGTNDPTGDQTAQPGTDGQSGQTGVPDQLQDPGTTSPAGVAGAYVIVDTAQSACYDEANQAIACPPAGAALAGQDGVYAGLAPSYTNNSDGTITDNNTGLMWSEAAYATKLSWADANAQSSSFSLAGYNDWRLPTIKELYSLMAFSGTTGMPGADPSQVPADAVPYIDTAYFQFDYGDTAAGERFIDAQYWSSTAYVSTTMDNEATAFGVNFADGRIKGYPQTMPAFVRYVRGNADYGKNLFADNGDGTITDAATGLTWMKEDSVTQGAGSDGSGKLAWADALAWCEDSQFAGHSDWRLPDAKELQSLVDYVRAPAATGTAAIDPLFTASTITDEAGHNNHGSYWTSTTHLDGPDFAVYVAFGEALGCMAPPGGGATQVMDVHGAGAQRSDPKTAAHTTIGCGTGPQGDVIRVYNLARCVR